MQLEIDAMFKMCIKGNNKIWHDQRKPIEY